MQTVKTVLKLTLTALFLLSSAAYAADAGKIGVVNFQQILDESSAGKSAIAEISKQSQSMKMDLEKMKNEIEEMKKRLEAEALVMSKEQRMEKERDFRIRVNDFKTLQQKYTADARAIEGRLIKRIREDVFEIVGAIGKKEGFALVIEKNEAGVLFATPKIDLSERVIKQYNDDVAKRAAEKKD